MNGNRNGTEVIPAILTDSADEFVRLVHILERAGVTRVHLDICDGVFVPTRSIAGYTELNRLTTDLKFDVHLMVAEPEQACEPWRGTRADRFIVHVEAVRDFGMLASHAHDCHKQMGAAINPETPLEELERIASMADFAQFMTVHPGAQGRSFVPGVLDRIRTFAANHPGMVIMADGGITPETAPQCVAAGASGLAVGSYIVTDPDPAAALQRLRAVLG
jgi:ribulose-phosphate 3-epimerase